jgi:hypothetical protein
MLAIPSRSPRPIGGFRFCRTRIRRLAALAVLLLLPLNLCGCGGGLDGTYTSEDGGLIDSITFKSGGKVELVGMGMTKEGDFEMDGSDRVKITVAGETNIFSIDDKGCINGGGILGKFCKK